MTETFKTEPVIGHHVEVEITRPEPSVLDDLAEVYGIPISNERRATITVGDVAWEDTQQVELREDTLEAIAEWYLSETQ